MDSDEMSLPAALPAALPSLSVFKISIRCRPDGVRPHFSSASSSFSASARPPLAWPLGGKEDEAQVVEEDDEFDVLHGPGVDELDDGEAEEVDGSGEFGEEGGGEFRGREVLFAL